MFELDMTFIVAVTLAGVLIATNMRRRRRHKKRLARQADAMRLQSLGT